MQTYLAENYQRVQESRQVQARGRIKLVSMLLSVVMLFGSGGFAQDQQGQDIYQNNCAQCHGSEGEGASAPALAGNEDLHDTQMVLNQIIHGGGGMPPFGDQLTDEQIAAVATHIRTAWGNDFGEVSAEQVAQQTEEQQEEQQESQQEQDDQQGEQQTDQPQDEQQDQEQEQAQQEQGQQQDQQQGEAQAGRHQGQTTALLQDREGNTVGNASFSSTDDGAVRIQVQLQGFTSASEGEHGIHIHETGECEPDFQAAGGHFNPTDAQHGLLSQEGPHAGDLPNILIDEDGNAEYEVTTLLVSLDEGDHALFDEDGSALVIHANADDHVTDPSGESGDRIACGVIIRGEESQGQQAAASDQQEEQQAAAHEHEGPGHELFTNNCAACHQANGEGAGPIPPLAGNPFVTQEDPTPVIEVVITGRGGMPRFGGTLSDEELADVVSHIRTAWENNASTVDVEQVEQVRDRLEEETDEAEGGGQAEGAGEEQNSNGQDGDDQESGQEEGTGEEQEGQDQD